MRVVVRRTTGTTVEDLDSRNGTFVNRRRIDAHLLEDGDEIQIGVYTLGYLERTTARHASSIASKRCVTLVTQPVTLVADGVGPSNGRHVAGHAR